MAWTGLVIAAAVVVVAVVYVGFWPLSDLIARHDVGAITGAHRAAALQAARDAARGRLVTFGAGLFAAGALIYTARNFTLSRRTVELTRQTVEIAGQGQVTDRYTKAIEQLSSDKGLDVRIGGIYALELVARHSAEDHPAVMEVLAAFVREHSREQWPSSADDEPGADVPSHRTRPDIQAALTVIGRRDPGRDSQAIDLAGANLAGANLSRANLAGARLRGADLTGASLYGADLAGANLTGANLTRAHLTSANLTSANLVGTNFTGADLAVKSILPGAGEPLSKAKIFPGADLTDAFISADFTGADLSGATVDHWAPVPEGWQRDAGSGRLRWTDTGQDQVPPPNP